MSSNTINNINTSTSPPTTLQQNQNDLFTQNYSNQQVQSTIPKTTGLIDDIKITSVLPNSLDTIGESYTFYQKPNESLATSFHITNNENMATNNIQNVKSATKGKEEENTTASNVANSLLNKDNPDTSKVNAEETSTSGSVNYPEIPLTANTKKKRSRNPSKIPRPQNCFIIYRREKHQIISAKNPGIANNDISKIIAKMWREEPPEVKEIYQNRAKEEAKRHMLANPGYKYTPRASKNRRKRKMNEENKKFEENHPLKHEFDNPPHQDKNHENIRKWIDNISSPSQEQNIINTLAQGSQNINSFAIMNPLQTTFDDTLYSNSNSGSLAYSSCSSASTSSTNLSVYSWSSNSLPSSNLSRGSSISNINEYPNIQQPARIFEYDFQKQVQPNTTQIYNPYDYKITQGMSQMHIQAVPPNQPVQPNQQIVLNVQQPNTSIPLQIQATTQQLQTQIQAQIPPQIQIQQSIPQMSTQNQQIGAQISPPIQQTNQQNIAANPMVNPNTQSPQATITYATTNIPNIQNNIPNIQSNIPNIQNNIPNIQNNIPNIQNNIPNIQNNIPNIQNNIQNIQNIQNNIPGEAQFIAVTNSQIQTVYAATQPNNMNSIPTYSNEIINPQYQEVKQIPQPQYQQQYYNVASQMPNMNNQGNFQNIYNNNTQDRRQNQ